MGFSEKRYRAFDGLELYYRVYGHGDHAMICFPGLARNSRDFERLAPGISGNWRLVCPDLRGRGSSDDDPSGKGYRHDVYVRDMWTLFEHECHGRAVLLGSSFGGWLAMTMAQQRPERVSGLVLNDIGPEVPRRAALSYMRMVAGLRSAADWPSAMRSVRRISARDLPGLDEPFWSDYVRQSHCDSPDGRVVPDLDPAIITALEKAYRAAPLLGLLCRIGLHAQAAPAVHGFWPSWAGLRAPILVLRGAHSEVLNASLIARMRKLQPAMHLQEIPGRGHAPLLDERASLTAIQGFLSGIAELEPARD